MFEMWSDTSNRKCECRACAGAHLSTTIFFALSILLSFFGGCFGSSDQLEHDCKELGVQKGITKVQVQGTCRKFAYCLETTPEVAICPPEFRFSVDKQDCDWASNVNCTQSAEDRKTDPECPKETCGIYPDAEVCSRYKVCHNGKSEFKHCGGDQLFDAKSSECVDPSEAKCKGHKKGLTLKHMDESARREKNEPLDQLCSVFWKKAMTKVSHPTQCDKFVYCAQGKAYLAACPGGLVFNSKLGDCDFPANVPKCKPSNEISESCISRPCGVYPTSDCQSFVICNEGAVIQKNCRPGLKFDVNFGACVPMNEATCWEPPQSSSPPAPATPSGRTVPGAVKASSTNVTLAATGEDVFKSVAAKAVKLCPFHNRPPSEPESSGTNSTILQSPEMTNFGQWMGWRECPEGTYITALQNFRRMAMNNASLLSDHAGLTSMAFLCTAPGWMGKPKGPKEVIFVISPNLPPRPWKKLLFYKCQAGAAIGFRLNQVPLQEDNGDNIGTDMIKLLCSCGSAIAKPYHHIEYKEVSGVRGKWTQSRICRARQALCGFEAQAEEWIESVDLSVHDNTGINQVKMRCCDVPSPALNYRPAEDNIVVTTIDNRNSAEDKPFPVDISLGLAYDQLELWEGSVQFYESIGYNLMSLKRALRTKFEKKTKCPEGRDCRYAWTKKAAKSTNATPSAVWSKPTSEKQPVVIPSGKKVTVHQVVGRAGPYLVKTNVLYIEDYVGDDSEAVEVVKKPSATGISILNPNVVADNNSISHAEACPLVEKSAVTKSLQVGDGWRIIGSKKVTNWGNWMDLQTCPEGTYVLGVTGFRSMVEGSSDDIIDQAGLTSIGFLCQRPGDDDYNFLTFSASGVSPEPEWEEAVFYVCDEGAAIGFEMNVMSDQGAHNDNLATDNVRLHCSCGPSQMKPFKDTSLKKMTGMRGEWGAARYCAKNEVICGAAAQMHDLHPDYDEKYDNTGLNGIKVKCCVVPPPILNFTLTERRELLVTLENDDGRPEKEAILILPIGTQVSPSEDAERQANFHDSVGYPLSTFRDKLGAEAAVLALGCPFCEYTWDHSEPTIFQKMIYHNETVLVPEMAKVEYFQIVASMGYLLIRTNQYVAVITPKTGEPEERPSLVYLSPVGDGIGGRRVPDEDDVEDVHKVATPPPPPPPPKLNPEQEASLPESPVPVKVKDPPPHLNPEAPLTPAVPAKVKNSPAPSSHLDFDNDQAECQFHNRTPAEEVEKKVDGISLSSPEVTNWGKWSEWKYCPSGMYVTGITGYREVVETLNDGSDRVGLAAVGFMCQNPGEDTKKLKDEDAQNPTLVFSSEEESCPRYKWQRWFLCRPGTAAIAFQMNVQENQGKEYDNVATDNVKIICSNNHERMKPYDKASYTNRNGHLGAWTLEQTCKMGQAICGVQVQLDELLAEANILEHDNTGVNNINMKCCDIASPETELPTIRRELVMEMDQLFADPGTVMKYTLNLEVGLILKGANMECFYNSIGYNTTNYQNDLPSKVKGIRCTSTKCDINWETVIPEVFMSSQWAVAKQTIAGGERIVTYQIVADAGTFLIKTNRYIQMVYDQDNNLTTRINDIKLGASPLLRLKSDDSLPKREDDDEKCPARETSKKDSESSTNIISSPKVTDWGDWHEWKECPAGSFITGVQAHRRVFSEDGTDHVGMISVGFQCAAPSGQVMGEFGFSTKKIEERNWTITRYFSCKDGWGTGFQLNVMADQGLDGDDIATDNIRLFCSCGPPVTKQFNSGEHLMHPGEGRGEWSQKRICKARQAVCGARVQSQPYIEGAWVDLAHYDNTGINNVEMRCCDTPPSITTCKPKESRLLIGSCDNTEKSIAGTCEFESYIGYAIKDNKKDKRLLFFESLGVDLDEEVAANSHHLSLCKDPSNCEYAWDSAPSAVFEKVKAINRTLKIEPFSKIELYQVVGDCGFVHVRSNRYILMTETQSGSKENTTWDVDDEPLSGVSLGRSFGGGREPKVCPFHGKPASPSQPSENDGEIKEITTSSIAIGAFSRWEDCPIGSYVSGMDSTSNTLICRHPLTKELHSLGNESTSADSKLFCDVAAVGVQVGKGGEVKLFCANGNPVFDSAAAGAFKGTDEHYCAPRMALCGSSQSQDSVWKLRCCPVESPARTCVPKETRVQVTSCDNGGGGVTSKCAVTVGMGVQAGLTKSADMQNCFFTSIGIDVDDELLMQLQAGFEKFVVSCPKCLYPWDEPKRNLWRKTVVGTYDIVMAPNEVADVYQIVGECGHIQVKTDRFVKKIVSTSERQNEEELVYISH